MYPAGSSQFNSPSARAQEEEDSMAKAISCKDVGMVGCDFTARAESMEELLQVASAHAKEAHGMDSIPPELMPVIQSAIRDE
jgi:predicted small metal-binding protein